MIKIFYLWTTRTFIDLLMHFKLCTQAVRIFLKSEILIGYRIASWRESFKAFDWPIRAKNSSFLSSWYFNQMIRNFCSKMECIPQSHDARDILLFVRDVDTKTNDVSHSQLNYTRFFWNWYIISTAHKILNSLISQIFNI